MASADSNPCYFDESLVSVSGNPSLQLSHQSQTGHGTGTSTTKPYPSTLLSSHQWEAVRVLCEIDNYSTLSWLRKVQSGCPQGPYLRHLSSQQFEAISTLNGCPSGLVLACLQYARHIGTTNGLQNLPIRSFDDVQNAAAASAPSTSQGSSAASINAASRSSAGSLRQLSPHSVRSSDSSFSQAKPLLESSSDFPLDQGARPPVSGDGHSHGCPLCDKRRVIDTCDGWKRHMKEHETIYPCMSCTKASDGKIKTYTRKANLVKHLQKAHDISTGAPVADAWRKTIQKKYFACGFCVTLCPSMTEQLNHIDNEHFKKFQDIQLWDWNTVIIGLLSQPGINEIWRFFFGSTSSQGLSWEPSVAKDLQSRLEVSVETAASLASAAINQANWLHYLQGPSEDTSATRPINQHIQTARRSLRVDHPPYLAQKFSGDPNVTPTESLDKNKVLPSQQYDLFWAFPEFSLPGLSYCPPPNTDVYDGPQYETPLANYQQLGEAPQQTSASHGDNEWTQPQQMHSTSWTGLTATARYDDIPRIESSVSDRGWHPPMFPVLSNSTPRTYAAVLACQPGEDQEKPNDTRPMYTASHRPV